jgi:hypothetical protein
MDVKLTLDQNATVIDRSPQAWWTSGKAYVPAAGGHGVDPQPDIDLARKVMEDWSDRTMRVQAFKSASLFRSRAPDCGPQAYCSDHQQDCEECIEHSIRVLLRWGEEREGESTKEAAMQEEGVSV